MSVNIHVQAGSLSQPSFGTLSETQVSDKGLTEVLTSPNKTSPAGKPVISLCDTSGKIDLADPRPERRRICDARSGHFGEWNLTPEIGVRRGLEDADASRGRGAMCTPVTPRAEPWGEACGNRCHCASSIPGQLRSLLLLALPLRASPHACMASCDLTFTTEDNDALTSSQTTSS